MKLVTIIIMFLGALMFAQSSFAGNECEGLSGWRKRVGNESCRSLGLDTNRTCRPGDGVITMCDDTSTKIRTCQIDCGGDVREPRDPGRGRLVCENKVRDSYVDYDSYKCSHRRPHLCVVEAVETCKRKGRVVSRDRFDKEFCVRRAYECDDFDYRR